MGKRIINTDEKFKTVSYFYKSILNSSIKIISDMSQDDGSKKRLTNFLNS